MHLRTLVLTGLGFVFLGLGAIGILLPVWPTTPFVLVSVACFSSSPRIKTRIMKISFFKEHIENYEHRTGLSGKTFWISIVWLWTMLLLSMFLVGNMWTTLLLLFIGTAVTCHILCMSKAREDDKN